MNRFLQGWQQIFGGERVKHKPFPKAHFYRPEELQYLSKSKDLSTIDKWAVATGKWAFEQSKDNLSDCKFASVEWAGGLMTTWVDGRTIPDTPSRQAEKFALLKEEGFELPERYEHIMDNYEGNRLVGNYFSSGNDVIKVEHFDGGRLIGESPKFDILRWNKQDYSSKKETIGYASFKDEIGKSIVPMSDIDKDKFVNILSDIANGKQQFNKILEAASLSYPPILGGTLPLELQKVHDVNAMGGKVIPTYWSVDKANSLRVGVLTGNSNKPESVVIDINNAYRYNSVLATIGRNVEKERVNGTVYSLVSLLGGDFGEHKIYAKKDNAPLLTTDDGIVNAVVASKDGRTIAFNLDTHKDISLSGSEQNLLLTVLKGEGETERQRLRDLTSIPLMKDYVESMREKDNLISGEAYLIPSHTTVSKLYGKYETNEEEYHACSHGSLSLHPDDLAEMRAELKASRLAFNVEMKKMIDAYNNKSYSFSEADVKKLEQLDMVLGNKLQVSTVRHQETSQGVKAIGNPALKQTEQRGQRMPESRFVAPSLLQSKADGRWHTQEHLEKKAYQEYGSILANSKGLAITEDGQVSVPMDFSGRKYSGATAMMLNIASRNNGYEVPVFLNLQTMADNGIRVKENAIAVPVITKDGVENVYNIDQTDYPTKHPQEYNSMKLNQVIESRLSSENKDAIESLVNNNRFTTKTSFDSSVGSASYSVSDNTIHVAPVGEYEKKDGFLQDFSEGLVMSTRKSQPASSRFENVLKEGLIAHLGSGLVGQKYGYDVSETAGSKFWKERLKNDPNYTKEVVNAAERSSEKIIDYVEKLQKGQNQSSNLDLRSTTPVDIDVDGNGIVESDENLAPDKKQSSDEGNSQDESHHQQQRFHR